MCVCVFAEFQTVYSCFFLSSYRSLYYVHKWRGLPLSSVIYFCMSHLFSSCQSMNAALYKVREQLKEHAPSFIHIRTQQTESPLVLNLSGLWRLGAELRLLNLCHLCLTFRQFNRGVLKPPSISPVKVNIAENSENSTFYVENVWFPCLFPVLLRTGWPCWREQTNPQS